MAVSGDLREMPLTTLISVNCNERNRSRLHLRREGQEAAIFFDGGQIVHITLGDRQEEEVIYELLTWEEGSFELEMDVSPPARTVITPWSNLVLEGMRLMDEEAAGWGTELDEWEETTQVDTILQEVNEMANLQELLKDMSGDIPGFVAAAVAGMDGLAIAEHSISPEFDMEGTVAQFALVMKLVQKTADQLGSGGVEDNLVTTETGYALTRFLGDGSFYLNTVVDKEAASLGNVRMMTRQYADELWSAIPRRGRKR
jgi:predicted regulator of Ras-like GTPase activity (Roadblock/LC7/MglB family)